MRSTHTSFISSVARLFSPAILLLFIVLCSSVSHATLPTLSLTQEEKDWLREHKVFRIGITPDWPPFEFLNEKGEYQGLSADFVRLASEILGIEIKIVSADEPWNIVMQKLSKSELDGVGSIFISDSRQSYINFSQPYVEIPNAIIVRDSGTPFQSMQELNGHRLAYMKGWVCQELLEKDYPEIKVLLNDKIEGMIGQVLLGTADAGLIDLASLEYYSNLHNLSGLRVAFISPFSPKLAFGFPKKDKIAAALFDKSMAAAPPEKIRQIREKWLRGPDSAAIKIRQILQGLALLAFVALFIFVWNIQLRRQVYNRTKDLEKEVEQNMLQAEVLKESEGKIRAFFDQTLQFISLLSVDGILLDVNDSSLQLLQTTREKVIGKELWETPWWNHSPDLQSKLKDSVEQVAKGALLRFEVTHKDYSGKLYYVDFSLKPYHDQFGKIVYLIAEGRDITQQHESLDSLKESEERFRLLFESSPDPCWLIQNSKIIECNAAAGKMFGFSVKKDFIGLHPGAISPEYQANGVLSFEAADEKMKQAFKEGVARFEWEHLHKDGSIIPVEITLSSITLKGLPILYCIGKDLTESKKMQEERNKLEQQFLQSQKMESIGRLAGGVAHDFNNLLTVIQGFTELILSKHELPGNVREMLKEIEKASASATALTRQLLAFSRKQIIEPRIINLNELITQLQKLLSRVLGEDVELKLSLSEDLGSCFADPGQIEQVLVNIAVNARDAMPKGGCLLIETANVYFNEPLVGGNEDMAPGQYLMLAVSDTGTGMTEEVKKNMFEPFFTTKELGKGTGLGLATVYGIVKQSGGTIMVYSELDHGTTFKIYLPGVAGAAEKIAPVIEKTEYGKNQLILVAEDEEILRELVLLGLPEFGYRVVAFRNGQEAIEYLKNSESEMPALLVTDVVMSGMNGRELANKVHEILPDLPTMYVSGYTQDAIVSHGGILEENIKFLSKPFSIAALAARIGNILASASNSVEI